MMRVVVILFTLLISNEILADIYRFTSPDGLIKYSDKPINSSDKPLRKTTVYSAKTTAYFYKYIDSNGVYLYTNKPKNNYRLISKTKVNPPKNYLTNLHDFTYARTFTGTKKSKFNELIAQAASRYQVDAKLVHAVIQTESAYNSAAQSPKGAVGLMQLMPDTARRFGVTDRNDPDQNVDGGTRYLKHLIKMFDPNLDLAVAAYNAGENAVIKYNNSIPPYPETQNYVKQVLALYKQ